MRYHALVDIGTNMLLAVHSSVSTLYLLEANIPDTRTVENVDEPHYLGTTWLGDSKFHFASLPPTELPTWTWNDKTRQVSPTAAGLVTNASIDRAVLINAKLMAVRWITQTIFLARQKIATPMLLQSTIYAQKEKEASECRASGYDKTRVAEWPYLFQYSELANIPLRIAADEILFKSAVYHEALARTETIRVTYLRQLWDTQDPTEPEQIAIQVRTQCRTNMLS